MNDDLALTVADLESMPVGAVVIDRNGWPWQRVTSMEPPSFWGPEVRIRGDLLMRFVGPLRVPAVAW